MVENGSNGGFGPLPPRVFQNESHDKFRELCAISTTGSLSARESRLLREHLACCLECRKALEEYEAVIAEVIPAMAADSAYRPFRESEDSASWSLDSAEAALFASLDERDGRDYPQNFQTADLHQHARETRWRPLWWPFAAGLLLSTIFGFSLYKIGIRHGAERAKRILPPPPSLQPTVQDKAKDPEIDPTRSASEPMPDHREIASLRARLADQSVEIVRLKEEQAQALREQDDNQAERIRLTDGQAELARKLQLAEAELKTVQQKLDTATGVHSQDVTRINALEAKADAVTEDLRDRDRELARRQELLDHDRDIRELMGSRDLYITDVYDVAKTGDTQKPFGRIFYSRGKTLKFYAYDLDQQPGITNASTFQAWGRRGSSTSRTWAGSGSQASPARSSSSGW